MKRFFWFLVLIPVLAAACGRTGTSTHPDWSPEAVIYEMNVRQYTPEGTLAAAQKHLPRLKDMGVDVVWLMPIYPIGVKERKGTLGSYYAISDYCAVNPEFGTMGDFRNFLRAAHKQGLKVILDWVANHTSPDAQWINKRPADWYVRDSAGNTIVQYDWTDIAKLNYDNADMRKEMVSSMRFWLDQGVDGFRCDMACEVPLDFWKEAISTLKSEYRGIFMLAEGEDPALHEAGFDASYSWKLHHLLNAVARGEKSGKDIYDYIIQDSTDFPADAFRLMFTSNHDENSWAGTEFERMGDAAGAMAVLTYTLPSGMPLIYTGQEIGLNKRFEFFEKDPIGLWEENEYTEFYRYLNGLKHNNPALRAGSEGGRFELVEASDSLFSFRRVLPDNEVEVSVRLKSPWTYSIGVR